MRNLTLNPVTGEWDYLTPDEWARLKCGYGRNQEVESWRITFQLNLPAALEKYIRGLSLYRHAKSWVLETLIRNMVLDVERQYHIALLIDDCFFLDELENSVKNFYKAREIYHELTKLSNSVSKRNASKRGGRRK